MKKRTKALLVLGVWMVVVAMALFLGLVVSTRVQNPGFCGYGSIREWKVEPTAEQSNYVVLTEENTSGALLSDTIRSAEMTPKGVLIGLAGQPGLRQNLLFVTPETIEVCEDVNLKVEGHVNDIYYDRISDEIFVATDGFGIYRHTFDYWERYTTEQGLPDDRIYDLYVGSDGRLLAGTWRGVAVFDGPANRWEELTPSLNEQGLPDSIHAILSVESGLWLGTIDDGLHRLVPNHGFVSYRTSDVTGWSVPLEVVEMLGSNKVRVLVEGPDGSIWVGTDPGLSRYNPYFSTWSEESLGPRGRAESILDLEFDQYGRLWSTGSGDTRSVDEEDYYWEGGNTLELGLVGGVFDENTIIIGTDGRGLYLGELPPE